MKKLKVGFEGTTDTTGYLFSLMKCLSAALRCGGYAEYADDIVASSGFAFRMWVDAGLCPSATSIWEFGKQKEWVENGGLSCGYVERLWGQDEIEEERRLEAVSLIRKSVDEGTAAVAWDVSGCEWGLITGYDEEAGTFSTLKICGKEDTLPQEKLGRLEIPILSVLTVTGKLERTPEEIMEGTKRLAAAHLRGEEWGDNAKGLAAYDTLIGFIEEKLSEETFWNLEYYLGTYAALKWYAWKYFEKYGEAELAGLYAQVYDCWKQAFDKKVSGDAAEEQTRKEIAELLRSAQQAEKAVLEQLG